MFQVGICTCVYVNFEYFSHIIKKKGIIVRILQLLLHELDITQEIPHFKVFALYSVVHYK